MILRPPRSTRTDTLFPYTTLFRSFALRIAVAVNLSIDAPRRPISPNVPPQMPPRLAGCSGTPGTILAQKNPLLCGFRVNLGASWDGLKLRSEEHTSELQSLMRISYAVFCLKKTTIEYT